MDCKVFTLILTILVLLIPQQSYSKGRILMLDDCINSMSNINIVYHYPIKAKENPILKAEKSWEFNANGDPYAAPFSGGVWYDEISSKFKMWYSAGGEKKHGLITCYAESDNGIDWTKPELDVIPGTNIVDTLEHDCVTVILDRYDKDLAKRYKMFCVRFDTPSAVSMVLKYSADGIHWGCPKAISGDLYDRCSAYYDAFRNKYVLSLKTKDSNNRRARNFIEHEDPEMAVSLAHRVYGNKNDKFIKFWFSADDDDPVHPEYPEIRPAIYNHDAIPYESILLGQFVIWQGPENKDCIKLNVQKRNEILLGYSYDGFNWLRPDKTPFIPVNSDKKGWDAGNIQSTMGSPIIVGDSLYFYYSGRYNSRPKHPSNFATGLIKLRRDGFMSAHADSIIGTIVTKPIIVMNEFIFVNLEALSPSSEFSVEVLDYNYNPILGFTKEQFKLLSGINSTKLQCKWNTQSSLTSLMGKTIRLKFTLKNCDMYSFWLSDSKNGESHGFTAGGGPGLSPSGIDIID